MTDMSGKTGGSGGPDGSSGEDVWLPYPETSALPDVGKIMKDLGIESTVPQGIPESGSPDVSVKPGGLGFDSFFGPPGGDVGFPSCPTSGEFPNVDKIMKDLSIESPVSEGIPENTSASPNAPDPPVRMCGFGFREEMLSKDQELDKNKNLPDASRTTCEKKTDLEDPKKNPKTGKAL